MNDYEKYKGNFLKRNYMGKLINDNGLEYQSRVGHWPEAEQLTDNSIELANFLNSNNLLQDDINIFEIGSGGCRNLFYINKINENINFFANDLNKESSFKAMHQIMKDKVTFYEEDTLSLIKNFNSRVNINILISSDHLMHLPEIAVVEILEYLKTEIKPKYILLRELFSDLGQSFNRTWPKIHHQYDFGNVYKLIDSKKCQNNGEQYSLKLYKLEN